jgi:hypothetical protein
MAAQVLLQFGYSLVVGGDAWEYGFANRFITTALPLLLVLVGMSLCQLTQGFGRDRLVGAAGRNALLITLFGVGLTAGMGIVLLPISPIYDGGPDFAGPGALLGLIPLFAVLGMVIVAVFKVPDCLAGGGNVSSLLLRFLILTAALLALGGNGAQHLTLGQQALWFGERDRIPRALAIGRVVLQGGTFATPEAGLDVWFSKRSAIDLTGKNDVHIASLPGGDPFWSRPPWYGNPYWPGHSKWDNEWSIATYRPDLIVDFHGGIGRVATDGAFLNEQGYAPMCLVGVEGARARVFVRPDSRVDWGQLREC